MCTSHSPLEMMAAMSKIADGYGLAVWIWYPAMDDDYSIQHRRLSTRGMGRGIPALSRIDAVFVPGGDPDIRRP